jgi:hypothetical protein
MGRPELVGQRVPAIDIARSSIDIAVEFEAGEVQMNHYARLNFLKDSEIVGKTGSEIRTKIIRRLMMAAIVGIVALVIIAEARLTPEDWLTSFVNCCSRI